MVDPKCFPPSSSLPLLTQSSSLKSRYRYLYNALRYRTTFTSFSFFSSLQFLSFVFLISHSHHSTTLFSISCKCSSPFLLLFSLQTCSTHSNIFFSLECHAYILEAAFFLQPMLFFRFINLCVCVLIPPSL